MSVSPPLTLLGDTNAPATPLLRATFTAADGTALGSYTPEVGPALTIDAGTWDIQSGRAGCSAFASGSGLASADLGQADVACGLDVRAAASGSGWGAGLVLRRTDANNLWIALMDTVAGTRIYEKNAGVVTSRASGAVTITPGQTYRLVARAVGSTITVYVDGVQKCQYASAALNQTVTRHGLYIDTNLLTRLDNLVVWKDGLVTVPGGVS